MLLAGGTIANRLEEIGGRHQGDIVLTDIQLDAALGGGIPIVYDAIKWVKGVVPFEIDAAFTPDQQQQILLAMTMISSRSCVRFVTREVPTHRQFLNITALPSGCWATLGVNALVNQMNLQTDGCMQLGNIAHQLLHVLGFTHPQSRPDRDYYVRVQHDDIDPDQKDNLASYTQGTIEDFGIPYDYESILHCQTNSFAGETSGRATVVPLDNVDIGQREALSIKDVRKLNKMYDYDFCGTCVRENCIDF
ncbi:zinc metalloproteinase nas-14-like [Anopheles bellator]|uniref:zinc metalloproteinase nas-14-like n=1 Tax=Anopheles bellator TaxID=139047 RepID=UPI00264A3D22|nr:zinc metalloproteinase nas-14-like [Anopheles bellator]